MLPPKDYRGQRAKMTMMELRAAPGDAIDRVAHGMVIDIEKNGKIVGVLAKYPSEDSVIHADGSITGAVPLTFRQNLGNGGYGE
jgi:hypothetical protein